MVSTHSHPKAAAHPNLTAPAYGWVFQHTAARRRLRPDKLGKIAEQVFQHTAARGRLRKWGKPLRGRYWVSTHSRAEAAAKASSFTNRETGVSTHSRAEAAAPLLMLAFPMSWSFNTQPREGGCVFGPDGRLIFDSVSTHSRAEAAGKSR